VPDLDLTGAGPVVRRVHKVHNALIAPHRALAGVGVYVLTEAGHERVFPMPDVISDDGLVHATFAPHERVVVRSAHSVVRPAATVRSYLNRRVRVRRGNKQLVELGRTGPESKITLGALGRLVRDRRASVVDAGCYLTVLVLDRALTRLRNRRGDVWASDNSTRVTLPRN
jgi:hypothetical protein